MQYTLAEIRNGTGFPPNARFILLDILYIAVVKQPAVSNVFLVTRNDFPAKRIRLEQNTFEYCTAFAYGYAKQQNVAVRFFQCNKGDATRQNWEKLNGRRKGDGL